MPKAITLGNGEILVGIDEAACVRDFYYPYVGLENHIATHHRHRIGIWADQKLHWLGEPSWGISIDCDKETANSNISAVNDALGVRLHINDIVYNETDIFIRKIEITNLRSEQRTVKLFCNQQFEISESHRGDTAYYDPRYKVLFHYKGRRVFLINMCAGKKSFDDYSAGLFETEGREGTHIDAHDGVLSKNPIEHGTVDSVIGMTIELAGNASETVYYWIAVGKTIPEAEALNTYILKKTPEHLMQTTQDFWRAWVNKRNFSFYGLDEPIVELFKKSLLIIRAHADKGGAILASGDSDMLQHGRDTYSYMWPRDGARAASALARAGDFTVARRFFEFCNEILVDEGYFLHKYRPNRSLGSSWHPWIRDGNIALPIQEDETALVLSSLWQYYALSRDLEFIEELYNPFIKKSADFLFGYTHKETGLPHPSYDLWEEKYGIATFTCSAKYSALRAAVRFSELLGKNEEAARYTNAADALKKVILTRLYDDEKGMFDKLLFITKEGGIERDRTVDMSSFFGVVKFDVLPADDERVARSFLAVQKELFGKTDIGGIIRYEGDAYYRTSRNAASNPWFVTTLWLAQYYIKAAKTEKDLQPAKDILAWAEKYALPSGVMSEQIDPYTGRQLSAAPLTWSHAEFVVTIIDYLEKLEAMGICAACNPVK